MKKSVLLLVAIFCLLSLNAKINKVAKTFSAENISVLELTSKYGEIKIENWERNEIAVEVVTEAISNREKTVEKILSNVDVAFEEGSHSLSVSTNFGTFFSFMKFTNNLFRNGEFFINYSIKMPKNIALDIKLHDGNIILFKRNAPIRIEHSNGYISSEGIREKAQIKMRNSHLQATKIDSLIVDCRNSNITLEKSQFIKAKSYNSDYEIKEVKTLELNSMRDKFNITKIVDLFVTSSLSDFTIESLMNSGIINTNYGDFRLKYIAKKFDEVKLNSKGTDLTILLDPTPANITITHHISTKLDIPDSMGLRMKFGETQKDFITTGKVGNPKSLNQLLINAKGGHLTLR